MQICKYIFLSLLLASVASPGFSQNIPDKSDLRSRLESVLPQYWLVKKFRVIASIKNDDPVAPKASIRFEADVSASYDLFSEIDGPVGPFQTVTPTFNGSEKKHSSVQFY